MKFDIWLFFETLSTKFKVHYYLIRITGTLHEDVSGNLREDVSGTLREDVSGTLREDVSGTLREGVLGTLPEDISGTLHEDVRIFFILSHIIIHSTINVSDKSCRENLNTHLMSNTFFPKM